MNRVLGIIGSGQLALYLCDAAHRLGFKVAILADSADAPALAYADRPFGAQAQAEQQMDAFLTECDVVTFDKEAIADDIVARLSPVSARHVLVVRPGADTLQLLKDKARQKCWLREHGLPTLPFSILERRPRSISALTGSHGPDLVQKRRSGGYDGHGVQVLRQLESPELLWDVPSIVEPFLADCVEVSVVAVRGHTGELRTYPPVEMDFDPTLHLVRTVVMPARLSPAIGNAAVVLAEQVVTLLRGVGVFAIEMFVTPAGELLINEISPRVHNSGHLTQDACNVSQFEQHVRAVMGLPLVAIHQHHPAAMCNLLYSNALKPRCPDAARTESLPGIEGATVYWYGKATGTLGRKMGHINAVAPDVTAAIAAAQRGLALIACEQQEERV
jgi:5-(carboxyamino)imidazole ribonucleotide synthase